MTEIESCAVILAFALLVVCLSFVLLGVVLRGVADVLHDVVVILDGIVSRSYCDDDDPEPDDPESAEPQPAADVLRVMNPEERRRNLRVAA